MDEERVLSLDVDGIKVLEDCEDVSFVQLDLLHIGENRNKCSISEKCVMESMSTIFNKPIIYKFNWMQTDVNDHAWGEDKTMNVCGVIPGSAKTSLIKKNGKTYLRTHGILFKTYQPKLMSILKKRNGNTKVSIEIVPEDSFIDENGIRNINKFRFLGVALLGEKIKEGIENSEMNVIKYSDSDINQMYSSFSKKYEVPEDISVKGECMENLEFAKEEWGKSPAIKVNKSKEAMSDSSWGDVDKTSLKNKILDAKNYKTLVNDVYLVVESGWEDHPSSSLKYPVMQLKGGELVYNRYGISSALGYAKAENNSEAIKKANGLYKKLDLGEGEKMSEDTIEKMENKDLEDNKKEDISVKYSELEKQCNELKEQIAKYARKEEVEKMTDMITKYSHCFSKEDKKAMESDVEKCSFSEMESRITNKVMEYALNLKHSDDEEEDKDEEDEKEEEKEKKMQKNKKDMKFSVGFIPSSINLSDSNKDSSYESIKNRYKKNIK